MSRLSFKEELVVSDIQKIKEIATALKQPKDESVRSVQPQKLPKDAGAIWFKQPIDERVPNATTIQAIEEGRRIAKDDTVPSYNSVDELRVAIKCHKMIANANK